MRSPDSNGKKKFLRKMKLFDENIGHTLAKPIKGKKNNDGEPIEDENEN